MNGAQLSFIASTEEEKKTAGFSIFLGSHSRPPHTCRRLPRYAKSHIWWEVKRLELLVATTVTINEIRFESHFHRQRDAAPLRSTAGAVEHVGVRELRSLDMLSLTVH